MILPIAPYRYRQSYAKTYPGLIFREVFNDEASVRRNGGVPNNVTFENGVAKFEGDGYITYPQLNAGTYSVRIRFKRFVKELSQYVIDFRTDTMPGHQTGYIRQNTVNIIHGSTGTEYINGEAGETIPDPYQYMEFIVSGLEIDGDTFCVGKSGSLAEDYLDADIDLIEVYNKELTPSEVANLYNNTWNKELSFNNLLLDFDSTRGTLDLGDLTDSATATDVSVKKIGQSYSADFNGSSSMIDTGSEFIGTRAITIVGWIKWNSNGEYLSAWVIGNGETILRTNGATERYRFSSNGLSTNTFSDTFSIIYGQWQFISVTRESDGTVNFYIGDKDTAPVLSGDVNQDSGTPTAGTTNVIIGNNDGQTRTFDGLINKLTVVEGILSTDEITRYWSSTRGDLL